MKKSIKINVKRWKGREALKQYEILCKKGENGLVYFLRENENGVLLSEPSINGIYQIIINNEGKISEIILF